MLLNSVCLMKRTSLDKIGSFPQNIIMSHIYAEERCGRFRGIEISVLSQFSLFLVFLLIIFSVECKIRNRG